MITYIVCKKDDKYYKLDIDKIININSTKILKFEDESNDTIKNINGYLIDKKFIKTAGDDTTKTHMTYYIHNKDNTLLLTIRKIISHENDNLLYIIEYEKDTILELSLIKTTTTDALKHIYQQFGIESVLD
jgi:hypothetical protein